MKQEESTASEAIGKRLRWAREQAGLSQGQIAKMLDYHRPTISQIENGDRNVKPAEIAKFAEIYDVKEEWIIRGDIALEHVKDDRIALAARELSKLNASDLDKILHLIKVMRSTEENPRE